MSLKYLQKKDNRAKDTHFSEQLPFLQNRHQKKKVADAYKQLSPIKKEIKN
jgi:hypothetical protein